MLSAHVDRDEWTPAFHQYSKQWADLSPTQKKISWIVQNAIRQAYASEGQSNRMPWGKRTREYPWPPLRKTGQQYALQLASTASAHYTRRGFVHTIEFRDVHTVTPYAKFHHTGTQHMPRREVLNLTPHEINEIHTVFSHHLLHLQ